MSVILIGLLGALATTNQPAATVTNLVTQTNAVTNVTAAISNPVDEEYHKLTEEDDNATAEVDKWIKENQAFSEKGGGVPASTLNARIHARLDPIKKRYQDFLKLHPEHVEAHLAFGSFLEDTHEEEEAAVEYEKARQLDPKNPTSWNQLANHFCEGGPIQKAFEYYEKAIELAPNEPRYYQNLAITVYLFRKDSKEYYKINEQQVFDKAISLYQKAVKLAPNDFELAQDFAQTYYGIKPIRMEEALNAWTNALNIAGNELEKEFVYTHLARFKLSAERFDDARRELTTVTNSVYMDLKNRLLQNIATQEQEKIKGTNAASATIQTNQPATAAPK